MERGRQGQWQGQWQGRRQQTLSANSELIFQSKEATAGAAEHKLQHNFGKSPSTRLWQRLRLAGMVKQEWEEHEEAASHSTPERHQAREPHQYLQAACRKFGAAKNKACLWAQS